MTSDDHKTALRAPDVDLLGCGDAIGRRHLQSKTATSGRADTPARPLRRQLTLTQSRPDRRAVPGGPRVRSVVGRAQFGQCQRRATCALKQSATSASARKRGLDAGDPVEHGRALRATAPAPHSRFAARRRARLDAHVLVAAHNQIHNFAAPRGAAHSKPAARTYEVVAHAIRPHRRLRVLSV